MPLPVNNLTSRSPFLNRIWSLSPSRSPAQVRPNCACVLQWRGRFSCITGRTENSLNYRLPEAWKHTNNIFLICLIYSRLNLVWLLVQGDFSAPDIPKSMAWCENSICVGFKRDYYLIRVRRKKKCSSAYI